jgi:hypothetical protein
MNNLPQYLYVPEFLLESLLPLEKLVLAEHFLLLFDGVDATKDAAREEGKVFNALRAKNHWYWFFNPPFDVIHRFLRRSFVQQHLDVEKKEGVNEVNDGLVRPWRDSARVVQQG